MGVTGLWDVVHPVARPVKLETLNRKRLAVDASIWIYQFLKAVRDKEGNALRNSHVVGFFRRICKLLFFGIKPVFVFDGGAPILKRQTISQRKARREGRREDMVRTAGKLLAKQMQHRAEEEERKRREARDRPVQQEEELPEELVYVEEQMMSPEQRKQNRQFKKKDAYHLPDLDVSISEMASANDPRIMSQEELEDYARQFNEGEDINLYDFSKIDFDGPFFSSLPATDRYNILNAARLRSRLRMGYSKEQLEIMFPNRMEFSRFQIERVKERNDLTQRLMNINGMNGNDLGLGRVVGEKGREYMLVKNDGVEGGWALGVVSNKDEGKREQPIDIEKPEVAPEVEEESDDAFEDIPIEGLNRLPKRPKVQATPEEVAKRQQNISMQRALLEGRPPPAAAESEQAPSPAPGPTEDDDGDGLFVPADDPLAMGIDETDDLFEDVTALATGDDVEDEELQRAIAMSLEEEEEDNELAEEHQRAGEAARAERMRKEKVLEFNKRKAASGRHFANYANARAAKLAPRPTGSDEAMNPELRAAFEAGRKMGPRQKQELDKQQSRPGPAGENKDSAALVQPDLFSGPLPFESLNLGKSLFTKKNKPGQNEKAQEEQEGGFEKQKEDKPRTPPPWFAEEINKEDYKHSHIQRQQEPENDPDDVGKAAPVFRHQKTNEVIDLDAEDSRNAEPVDLLSSDEEAEVVAVPDKQLDSEIRMEDVADLVRAEPPVTKIAQQLSPPEQASDSVAADQIEASAQDKDANMHSPGDASLEWDESDYEQDEDKELANPEPAASAGDQLQTAQTEQEPSRDPLPEPEFENVEVPSATEPAQASPEPDFEDVEMPEAEVDATAQQSEGSAEPTTIPEDVDLQTEDLPVDEDFDEFSDPEDEQLMKQLAEEAEEHARFAAQLNVATGLQSAADYERELKQLRNQQKAERRDADEVSQVMITECQQLLRLFGLPYITAPMEAEAQCAELLALGLVDGIVTDDSDIFLFGGTRVYKNMFNQAKEVQCYLAGDLEKEYGLSRTKIIQVAHLLGSDYTEGIPNVGPVTALDILGEFDNLKAFSDWWTDVQTGMAPQDSKGFKKKFRKNAAKIFLPPGFPDPRVDLAYLKPEVDSDPSEFKWGVPDLDALRQFLMATIGWSQERTDEILVPVIKDINRRDAEGTQANITRFFGGGVGSGTVAGREAHAPRKRQGPSARMQNALGRLQEKSKRGVDEDEGEAGGEDTRGEGDGIAGDGGEERPAPKKRKTEGSGRKKKKAAAADMEDSD